MGVTLPYGHPCFTPLKNMSNYFWIDRCITVKKLRSSDAFLSSESAVYLMCYIGIIHRAWIIVVVVLNFKTRKGVNIFICVFGIIFDLARLVFFFQGNKGLRFCKDWGYHDGHSHEQKCVEYYEKRDEHHAVYLKHSDKNLLCMHGYITTDEFDDKFMFLGVWGYYSVLSSFYFG